MRTLGVQAATVTARRRITERQTPAEQDLLADADIDASIPIDERSIAAVEA